MCIKGLDSSFCSSVRSQPPAPVSSSNPMDRGKIICGTLLLAGLFWDPTVGEGNRPSSSYGPPGFGGNGGNGGSRPSSNYGPPSGPGGGGPGYAGGNGGGNGGGGNGGGGYNGGGGGGGGNGGGGNGGGNGEASPEPFNFSYEVKDPESGNDFSHRAESDGKTVNGEYRVLLPDGRKQIVTYKADDGGYNADVKYEGEASNGGGGGGGGGGNGGYPSGGGGGGNGGYPSGGPSGGGNGGYPSGGGGNGGGNGGYPSGGPSGGGFPSGGGGNGGSNGYPSGGPSGNGFGGGSPSSSYLPPGK